MKKTVKILAVVMSVLMLMLCLASCGNKLSGKYTAEIGTVAFSINFDGKNAEFTLHIDAITAGPIEVTPAYDSEPIKATYEIKDDKISFDFADETKVDNTVAKAALAAFEAPQSFEKDGDNIKIGKVTFTKQG